MYIGNIVDLSYRSKLHTWIRERLLHIAKPGSFQCGSIIFGYGNSKKSGLVQTIVGQICKQLNKFADIFANNRPFTKITATKWRFRPLKRKLKKINK